MIKDHVEIDLMPRAFNVSSLAHSMAMHQIMSMEPEAEVYGHSIDVCIALGAKRQAYPPIDALGTNASILHYTESLKGRSVLCLANGNVV